jgi:hypothetical protein
LLILTAVAAIAFLVMHNKRSRMEAQSAAMDEFYDAAQRVLEDVPLNKDFREVVEAMSGVIMNPKATWAVILFLHYVDERKKGRRTPPESSSSVRALEQMEPSHISKFWEMHYLWMMCVTYNLPIIGWIARSRLSQLAYPSRPMSSEVQKEVMPKIMGMGKKHPCNDHAPAAAA